MSVTCPKCQFNNPTDTNFCGRNGTRLNIEKNMPVSATLTIVRAGNVFSVGSLLAGQFEVLEEIGTEEMGTVYKIADQKINEEMALKVLRTEITSYTTAIERLSLKAFPLAEILS